MVEPFAASEMGAMLSMRLPSHGRLSAGITQTIRSLSPRLIRKGTAKTLSSFVLPPKPIT